MARVLRYQDSMNKFIKNKSCITNLDGNMRIIFDNIIKECDNMVPIILLTVLGTQSKKKKVNLHGYHIGSGIELVMLMAKIIDNRDYYNKNIGILECDKLLAKIPSLVNLCLSNNIEHIQTATSNEKSLKIFHTTIKILNNKLFDINNKDNIEYGDLIKRTDVLKYNFENINSKPSKYISQIRQAKREDLINYINKKFGSVCQAALTLGWLLGGGDEKNIYQLEKIGTNLGMMMKLSYDFKNLERDLYTKNIHTNNFIINFGIQEGFELFIDSKLKFVEGCMTLDTYTHTIKEVIDVVEQGIEKFIDKTVPDMKSTYTI